MTHNAEHPRLSALIQQAVLEGGDQLELLVDRWYRPYAESISRVLAPGSGRQGPPGSPEAAEASTARTVAFNTLILGYFSLAPLHAELLGVDPLSPDALAAHPSCSSDSTSSFGTRRRRRLSRSITRLHRVQ